MPRPRKYPIRIIVDGELVYVKPVGGDVFRSKKHEYRVEYDASGNLIGKRISPRPFSYC